MKTPKPSEEEMILYFYGEAADRVAFERALADDPETAARYERLRRDLEALPDAPSPEPPTDLSARVWDAIRPRLVPHRSWRGLFALSTWAPRPAFAVAAAVVVALALGVVVGRQSRPAPELARTQGLSDGARERLLLASVSNHLGGSERLFAQIANDPPADAEAIAAQRRWAAALAGSNRLYRTAAERAGQRRIVALLDQLEPLLLELANAPDDAAGELSAAQRRIDENDLLFKLRVAAERAERDSRPAPKNSRPTTTS